MKLRVVGIENIGVRACPPAAKLDHLVFEIA